jgi:predicted hydrocarbon binding protein
VKYLPERGRLLDSEPKYVGVSMYDPEHALFLVAARTKNVPGALGDIAGRIGKAGVNILSVSNYALSDKPESTISFFAEAKDPDTSAEAIGIPLSKSPFVLDHYIKKAQSSLLVDDFSFPLMYFPAGRGILLPESGLTAMFQDMIKLFGTGGEAILFRAGYSVGRQTADELAKLFGEEEMLKQAQTFAGFYCALGWGKMEVLGVGSGPGEVTYRLTDGFESAGVTASKPNCHFIRGLLAGESGRLTGVDLSCEEESCAAVHDNYCQFRVSRKSG